MAFNSELWRDIKDYEGVYKISNLGNIKSFSRYKEGVILKKTKKKIGYSMVVLGRGKHKYIHRLVAETFLENIQNKRCVNHINGIKDDNRLENLEWTTDSENHKHSYLFLNRTRNTKKWKNSSREKVSKRINQYTVDGVFIKEWYMFDLEKEMVINKGNIYSCCRGVLKSSIGFKWKYV